MRDPDNPPVVFPTKLPPREEVSQARYEQIFEQVLLCTVDELLSEAMRYALVITRVNRADAHDLVNDMFAKLQAYTFTRPTKGVAWAITVMRHEFRDRWRKARTEANKLGSKVELTAEIADTISDHHRDVADIAIENVFSTPISQAASEVIEEFIAAHEPSDVARVLRAMLDSSTGRIRSRNAVAELTGLHPSKVYRLSKPALERLKTELLQLYKELQAGDGDVAPEFFIG